MSRRVTFCMLSLSTAVAISAGAALTPAAFAEGASWTSIVVKEKGPSLDQATVTGSIADAAGLADPVAVTVRLGEHAQTLPSGEFVRTPKKITWKAAAGATGVQSFTLTLKSGKFTVKAKGIEVGDLLEHVPFSIDVGGRSIATRHELSRKRGALEWKKGQPMRAVVTAQVFEVTHALGNVLLRPATGTFPGGAGAPGVTVLDADRTVSPSGTLTAEVEVTDASALGAIDMSAVFGSPSGFTDPGFSRVTAGDDGESQAVVFVEEERGQGRTIPPAGATIDSPGADGAPSGTLSVPAGAVAADLPGVRFTPLGLGVLLPAPLPDAYTYIAAAELSASSDAEFAAANAPTMTLSRPSWADRAPLSESDIRLLWWDGAAWIEQAGAGAYDDETDRIGPSSSEPARIPATGVSAYAAKSASATAAKGKPPAPPKRRVRGRVTDKDAVALRSQVVLTRAGAMVTGADGTFEVPVSALSGESLEVVQAIGDGASISRTVTGEEAEDDGVEILSARTVQPSLATGQVSGTVFEPGGTTPSPGATVTVRLATAVRGVELDDGAFADDFGDDLLRVPDLSDLGVASFRWSLRLPGDRDEFVSAVTGREIGVVALMIEAQDGGRTLRDGAYTVRVAYDVPVLGEISLYAGFRRTSDGIGIGITDVQLPAAVESTTERTVTANADGAFLMTLESVRGIPMVLTAESADGVRADVRSFQFASSVSISPVLPFGPEPTPPAGLVRGKWAARAPMNTPRERFGCAVLDGKIWVAGGRNGGALSSVESFDPHANAWTPEAPLPGPRDGVALAAADGRLYAIGGHDGGALVASVSVYDPATGLWSAGVPLPVPREDAKVAVLDGKIWAFSGVTNRTFLGDTGFPTTSTTVFDLASGTWSAGPSLPVGGVIGGGAAALDGNLYVRGNGNGHYEHFLVLDPQSAEWTALPQVGNLGRLRTSPLAVLEREVFCLSGYDPPILDVATSYSPDFGDETYMFFPPAQRTYSSAAALDGVLYSIGGHDGVAPTASVEAYLPSWTHRTDMPGRRNRIAGAVAGGYVHLAGGGDASASYATHWRYDPTRDLWAARASMTTAREDHGMAEVEGILYAVGGVTLPAGTELASVEAYDPSTNAWTSRAPMSKARRGHCVVAVLGKVYAIGGPDGSVEAYDPVTDAWLPRAPLPYRRVDAAAVVANNRILVMGGSDGVSGTTTVDSYNPVTDTWTSRAGMIGLQGGQPVSFPGGHRAATVGGGVYSMGGRNTAVPHGIASVETYRYDVQANSWSEAPFPVRGVRNGAAVTIGGRIHYFGGTDNDLSADGGSKTAVPVARTFVYLPD
ncbi:MAG: N-acetylneuraminate epimerase [Planctomycetes bacterium]|nr:N-acetylneuraminate epimerase [Planctomycetota bacterium]